MRILFTTRGSSGHVGPLVPVARACERAGMEVKVAAQEQFGANVERAGLDFVPFDSPQEDEWMPLMGQFAQLDFVSANNLMIGEFFARLDVAAELPRLSAFVDEWRPGVIVRESWEFGSTLVAETHGIPMARVGLGLGAVEEESIVLAAPAVDDARRAAGLPPDPEGNRLREVPYLTAVPAVLEDPSHPASGDTRRFRFETTASPAPLPDWWALDASPLVYLTFGSVAAGSHLPYYPDLYRAAIDRLAGLPVRVLVTVGDAEREVAELGQLPPNVHVETWVSHDEAAAAADVVVCHGGFGSTLETLAHATPLVVLPIFSSDQWDNAEAVMRAGAGIMCADDRDARSALALPSPASLDCLSDGVERVLADAGFRTAAGNIQQAMRELPPIDDAVDVLAALRA